MKSATTVLLLALVGLPPRAAAIEALTGTKLKAAVPTEGARDLGLLGADDTQEAFADLSFQAQVQWSQNVATFLRAQGFASTGGVVQGEDNRPVRAERFAALRELWFEYGGITTFPGEALRLGLQRVREPDGLWWDQEVESLRWIFDTTLVQGQLALAQPLDTWRTDEVELSPSQRDRAYLFGGIDRQWTPGSFYGARAAYAHDHGGLPAVGGVAGPDDKRHERRFLWLAVHAHNGFFDVQHAARAAYWAEVSGMFGTDKYTQQDALTGEVYDHDTTNVGALAGDFGLRLRLSPTSPLQIGAAYAFAQGGRQGDWSHLYEQTGLQSNRSRYTGTRSQLNRFNDALQADLSNLHALSVFGSMLRDPYDASLVYHVFRRYDGGGPVSTDGVDIEPLNASTELGTGWDFVLTRFFGGFGRRDPTGEDLRSNLRLRASLFQPGAAYGPAADDQYRVVLEATLWF